MYNKRTLTQASVKYTYARHPLTRKHACSDQNTIVIRICLPFTYHRTSRLKRRHSKGGAIHRVKKRRAGNTRRLKLGLHTHMGKIIGVRSQPWVRSFAAHVQIPRGKYKPPETVTPTTSQRTKHYSRIFATRTLLKSPVRSAFSSSRLPWRSSSTCGRTAPCTITETVVRSCEHSWSHCTRALTIPSRQ